MTDCLLLCMALLGLAVAILAFWVYRLHGALAAVALQQGEDGLTQGRLLACSMRHAARLHRLEQGHPGTHDEGWLN